MKILRNQSIIDTMAENIVKNELSNIAAVLAVPQVITTYYSIDAEYSQTIAGYQNIHDFIAVDSTVAFNKVKNMPMAGIDNLLISNQYNDEVGMDVDFESDALILPKTVNPKQNDFFTVSGMLYPTLFVVTDVQQTLVRSNPFVQIHFKVAHMDQDWIDQIDRQVLKTYTCSVSSLGGDKTLLIEEGTANDLQHHIQNYMEAANMYIYTYYDRSRAAFVFDGLRSDLECNRICLIDMVLWRLMYEFGIVVYDDVLTYAANNYNLPVDRVFIDKPVLVNDYRFKNSIIYRILDNNHNKTLNEFPYPMFYQESTQITKYQGVHVIYIEGYDEKTWCHPDPALKCFMPFDAEQILRMANNEPFEEGECEGWSLRNALISYYNGEDIDFDSIEITDKKTLLNYYYIPIILGIYKNYIIGLQNGTSGSDTNSTLNTISGGQLGNDTSTTSTTTETTAGSGTSVGASASNIQQATQQASQTMFNLMNGLDSSNNKSKYNSPLGGIGT